MNIFCDVCSNDSNKTKGAYLIDGDETGTLSFLCPNCYQLSYAYSKVSKMNLVICADEVIDEINKYEKGAEAIDILDSITSQWQCLDKIIKSLLRVYWAYLAGIIKHPMYRVSMQPIIVAIVYGVGFPTKDDAVFFTLNMNISTSANNYLFRRSIRKLYKVKIKQSEISMEEVSNDVCESCLCERASFTCRTCKAAHYCSVECLIKNALDHALPCQELVQINNQLELLK